jgi:acetoin utilization protein AcuB
MRLFEIMTTDVQMTSPEEDAEAAYNRMRTQRIRHLVVMEDRQVVGILSERDLGGARGAMLRRGKTVAELMSRQTVTAAPTTTIRQAANLMRARSIGCLPIVEESRVVGIVTLIDLAEVLGRGAQQSPTMISRWKAAHGSKWKPVRRIARPRRPPMFPR